MEVYPVYLNPEMWKGTNVYSYISFEQGVFLCELTASISTFQKTLNGQQSYCEHHTIAGYYKFTHYNHKKKKKSLYSCFKNFNIVNVRMKYWHTTANNKIAICRWLFLSFYGSFIIYCLFHYNVTAIYSTNYSLSQT